MNIIILSIIILSIIILTLVIYLTIKKNNSKQIKILMIGNSYTFKNNMPAIFRNLLGDKYTVDCHVFPRLNLTTSFSDQKVKDMITQGKYKFVVLQEQSARIIMAGKSFKEAAKDFIKLIRSVGSQPVLFEPWAYQKDHSDYIPDRWTPPNQCPTQSTIKSKYKAPFCYRLKCRDIQNNKQSDVTKAICSQSPTDYTTTPIEVQKFIRRECDYIKKHYDIPVIYIGDAIWNYSDPNLLFNYCDKKHTNLAGSYLIALMLYKYFTNKNVTNLPDKMSGCIDCPEKGPWNCIDCCYKPYLNADVCFMCNNRSQYITLDQSLVKNLQQYVQNFNQK